MEKPIYLGFAVLELRILHKYETYYDILQSYSGDKKLQLHYVDADGMILRMKTQNFNKDLKILEDIFDFSSLDKNHEIFSLKNEKVFGKFRIEAPKKIWIDEFVCQRSKMFSL